MRIHKAYHGDDLFVLLIGRGEQHLKGHVAEFILITYGDYGYELEYVQPVDFGFRRLLGRAGFGGRFGSIGVGGFFGQNRVRKHYGIALKVLELAEIRVYSGYEYALDVSRFSGQSVADKRIAVRSANGHGITQRRIARLRVAVSANEVHEPVYLELADVKAPLIILILLLGHVLRYQRENDEPGGVGRAVFNLGHKPGHVSSRRAGDKVGKRGGGQAQHQGNKHANNLLHRACTPFILYVTRLM